MGKIFLIIGIVVVSLVVLFFIIKFATKPKINYKKSNNTTANSEKKANAKPEVKKVEGLVFEEKFVVPEEPVSSYSHSNLRNIQRAPYKTNRLNKKQSKSLAEQINELSPELKALILDKGLARKDVELKSKKN